MRKYKEFFYPFCFELGFTWENGRKTGRNNIVLLLVFFSLKKYIQEKQVKFSLKSDD